MAMEEGNWGASEPMNSIQDSHIISSYEIAAYEF